MGEGLVGFSHLVGLFALANSVASFVGGVHQLTSKLLGHAATIAGAGEAHQPTQSHGGAALLAHFHGYLVGGTADAAGTHFHQGSGVLDSRFEQLNRVTAGALTNQPEGVRQDPLRGGFLPVLHQTGHHHRGQSVVELGIGKDRALDGGVTA